MWFIRRMQRVIWTARNTNEENLRYVGQKKSLIKCIRIRQLKFLRHILRARGIERDCLLGMFDKKKQEEDRGKSSWILCWTV